MQLIAPGKGQKKTDFKEAYLNCLRLDHNWKNQTHCNYQLYGHTRSITQLYFVRHDTQLLSASVDGTVRLWDVLAATPKTIRVFDPSHASVLARDKECHEKLNPGQEYQPPFEAHMDAACVMLVSSDHSLLYVAHLSNVIRVWSLHDGTCLYTLPGDSVATCMDLSDRHLLVGYVDGTAALFDTNEFSRLQGFDHRKTTGVQKAAALPHVSKEVMDRVQPPKQQQGEEDQQQQQQQQQQGEAADNNNTQVDRAWVGENVHSDEKALPESTRSQVQKVHLTGHLKTLAVVVHRNGCVRIWHVDSGRLLRILRVGFQTAVFDSHIYGCYLLTVSKEKKGAMVMWRISWADATLSDFCDAVALGCTSCVWYREYVLASGTIGSPVLSAYRIDNITGTLDCIKVEASSIANNPASATAVMLCGAGANLIMCHSGLGASYFSLNLLKKESCNVLDLPPNLPQVPLVSHPISSVGNTLFLGARMSLCRMAAGNFGIAFCDGSRRIELTRFTHTRPSLRERLRQKNKLQVAAAVAMAGACGIMGYTACWMIWKEWNK